MKTPLRLIATFALLSCFCELNAVPSDCRTYQDIWQDLKTKDDIEKLTKFYVKVGQDENNLAKLNYAVRDFIEKQNVEEFTNKVKSLDITETSKNCENLNDEWKGIIENSKYDLEKLQEFLNESKKVHTTISTFYYKELTKDFITKYVELILQALKNYEENGTSNERISFLLNNIKKNIPKSVIIQQIFEHLIKQMQETYTISQIPDVIWRLYQKDLTSLEYVSTVIIQSLLAICNKGHKNEQEFLYKIAYRFFQIPKLPYYNDLSRVIISGINNYGLGFPQSLQNLFSKPSFCLTNVKYSKLLEIYNPNQVNHYVRLISNNTAAMDSYDNFYFKADFKEIDQQIKFSLKSTKHQTDVIMDSNTNKLVANDFNPNISKPVWHMEYLENDSFVLLENDYVMCAENSYDQDKHNIVGLKKSENSYSQSECQWYIGDCYVGPEAEHRSTMDFYAFRTRRFFKKKN